MTINLIKYNIALSFLLESPWKHSFIHLCNEIIPFNLQLQKLEDNEIERSRRHEQQMKSLEQQRAELEERERNFERERCAFEATHQEYADMFRKMTIDNRE